MSCFHPIKAWINGTKSNGKLNLVFKEQYLRSFVGRDLELTSEIEIPCGQCLGCRLDYSRQWADRCMMELEDHDSAYFVTLTYDDEHVPIKFLNDPDTGEIVNDPVMVLDPKHLTDFWKRLRKAFPNDHIRYFACGEYGSQTLRPHYHAIIYGLHLSDLKFYKRSNLKDVYYNSPSLQAVWPYGFVVIGDVSWESCAYVARYVVKKAKGKNLKELKDCGFVPEFIRMSRGKRPEDPDGPCGIGAGYLVRHRTEFESYGSSYLALSDKSLRIKTPRYGKQIFEKDKEYLPADRFSDMMDSIERGTDFLNSKLSRCDYDKNILLNIEEADKIRSTKALRREL